jgi:hypothetical protein
MDPKVARAALGPTLVLCIDCPGDLDGRGIFYAAYAAGPRGRGEGLMLRGKRRQIRRYRGYGTPMPGQWRLYRLAVGPISRAHRSSSFSFSFNR